MDKRQMLTAYMLWFHFMCRKEWKEAIVLGASWQSLRIAIKRAQLMNYHFANWNACQFSQTNAIQEKK